MSTDCSHHAMQEPKHSPEAQNTQAAKESHLDQNGVAHAEALLQAVAANLDDSAAVHPVCTCQRYKALLQDIAANLAGFVL